MPLVMDTRPAAYAVIIEEGKILLTRWVPQIPGYRPGWTLPGGGLEVGEQPAQAAIREVEEETGYQVELEELLGVQTAYFEPRPGSSLPFCAFRTIYRGRVTAGSLRNEEGGSSDRAQWIPLDQLDSFFCYSLVDEAARLLGYSSAKDLAASYRAGQEGQ